MTTGKRTCTHYCTSRGYEIAADPEQGVMAITDQNDVVLAQISYIRGYGNHPNRGQDEAIEEMETAMILTNTREPPDEESSTEGAEDAASSGGVDSDNPDGSDPDTPPDIPDYSMLYEAPPETVSHGSPQPGPSGTQRPVLEEEATPTQQTTAPQDDQDAHGAPMTPTQWALIMERQPPPKRTAAGPAIQADRRHPRASRRHRRETTPRSPAPSEPGHGD